MDTQKKYRWALSGLIVMLLLNAAVLLTLWLNKPVDREWRQQRMDQSGRSGIHQFMKKELGLTEVQIDSMATLRRQHFQEMDALREKLESNRRAYFDFIMSPQADNAQQRDSLLTQLTNQYIQVEGALYKHMSEMKTILNPNQQQKFQTLMKETFLRDKRHGGSGGPGRNR